MEVSEVRQRLLQRLDAARRMSAERRTRSDRAVREYERFLADVATPLARMLVQALRAEGYLFSLSTPSGSIRLSSDRSSADFLEIALDRDADPPRPIVRASRTRGGHTLQDERPVREDAAIPALTEADVLEALLEEIAKLLIR